MANPMETYEKIKKLGPNAKADADAFMQELTKKYAPENPAPKEAMQKGLEGILAKHQSPYTNSRNRYLAIAAAVLLAVALGMPYSPPPIY